LQNSRFRSVKPKLSFFFGIFFTKEKLYSSSALEELGTSRKTMFLYKVHCSFDIRSVIYHAPNYVLPV